MLRDVYKRQVSDTVGRAMDNVSRGLKNGGWYRENPADQRRQAQEAGAQDDMGRRSAQQDARAAEPVAEQNALFLKGTSSRVGGIFLAVTGIAFGVISLIFVLFFCLGALAAGWSRVLRIGTGAFVLFALIFAVMAMKGISMSGSAGRFRKYVAIVGNREYCDIKEPVSYTHLDVYKRQDLKNSLYSYAAGGSNRRR